MKRKAIFMLFLISCLYASGQQANITLNTPHNGDETYIYEARDNIDILDGFSYSPLDDNYLVARINEDMVLPVYYASAPIDVDTRNLNYNLPVGTTAGSHSVSLTGAATYQIPITIPPGTAGMEPSVSLVYNSQAVNGLLGYGWNIAGLSAITRVGHTIYHDGEVKGVDFVDDRFALDGQRLIVISGEYGANNSVYYTEMFNGSRITSKGTAGGGPEYFIVETKDGKTIYYGANNNSRFVAQGKTDVLMWKINRIEDRMGNYIEFEYHKEATRHYIKEIRYTGNDIANPALEPYSRIHFYYSEREDKQVSYIAGSKIENNVLLDHIKVFAGNSLVRKYKLKYHYDFYSHLIEVKEYNSYGERYNSTVFEWESYEHTSTYGQQFNQSAYDYFAGDFNGDGKSDLFTAHYYYDDNSIKYYDYYKLYEATNPFNTVDEDNLSNIRGIITGDYNGDGISDVILIYRIEESSSDTWKYYKWITEPEGFSFNKSQNGFTIAIQIPEDEYPFKSFYSADFNGDMQSDVIFNLQTDYQTSWVVHIMGDDFGSYINKTSTNDNEFIKIADFTGSGKDEIMAILNNYTTSCIIYEYNNINESFEPVFSGGYPTKDHSIFTGDFNGDGKDDVMTWCETVGWELTYFTGDSWQQLQASWPGDKNVDPTASIIDNNYHIADFNSDGKEDILEYYTNCNDGSALTSTYNIFYFNGSTFDKYNINNIDMYNVVIGKDLFGDFDGDGNLDIITGEYQTSNFKIIKFNTGKPVSNIIKSANGFNFMSYHKIG